MPLLPGQAVNNRITYVRALVWDPDLLEWVPQTAAAVAGGASMDEIVDAVIARLATTGFPDGVSVNGFPLSVTRTILDDGRVQLSIQVEADGQARDVAPIVYPIA